MQTLMELGNIRIDVVWKEIKHLHLSVLPPEGRVHISAPIRMNNETIRLFAINKLGWIRQQQRKFRQQVRETPREGLERESHYLWGQRYLLHIEEVEVPPKVEIRHRKLCLHVRPGTSRDKRLEILQEWYRREVRKTADNLLTRWEPLLEVKVQQIFVQKMKTKWGSCNPLTRTIRLNTELAKKPIECLEYVLVHELAHFLDHTHGEEFTRLLDGHLPNWRSLKQAMNEVVSSSG